MLFFNPHARSGEEVWLLNPGLDTVREFAELIEVFGRDRAGRVLTAIYLVHDPASVLREGMDAFNDAGRDQLANQVLPMTEPQRGEGGKRAAQFSWEDDGVDRAVRRYGALLVTAPERMLAELRERLDRAKSVLGDWEPNQEDVAQYMTVIDRSLTLATKLNSLTDKVYETRAKYLSLVYGKSQDQDDAGRGGKMRSLIESFGYGN